ncbi:MAG: DUF3800 domain-containing protein, partial [Chloroflexota bacterium]
DKRYTHQYLRQKLEWHIRESITDVPNQTVVIRQEDSRAVKQLQAADFVAWAAGQKYVYENDAYCQIVQSKIVTERVVAAK